MSFDGWVVVSKASNTDIQFVMFRTKEQAAKMAARLASLGAEVFMNGFQFMPDNVDLVQ